MASPKKEENSPPDYTERPFIEPKSVVLEAKEVAAKPVEPEVPKPPEKKTEIPVKEKVAETQEIVVNPSLFPTEFYSSLGIPICSKCGSKRLTNEHGTICAIGSKECPLIG